MQIKKISNKLKKEKILFKSKVKRRIEESNQFLETLEFKDEFEVLDTEVTNIISSRLKSLELNSKGKAIANGASYADLESNLDEHLARISEKFMYIDNVFVYVFPREKLGALSILMSLHDLFINIQSIMQFYDDDLDIHEHDFSNSLFITVDRVGTKIDSLELVKNGLKWKDLI